MGGVRLMMKQVIFEFDESPLHPGKYLIRPNLDKFYCSSTEGSYNVLCARVMNLSYASYLRMCRDIFGAEIYGKDSLYPVAFFSNKLKARPLLDNLNARANLIIFDREHPDYKEHEKAVLEHEQHMEAVNKRYEQIRQ